MGAPSVIPIQNIYYLLLYAWNRLAEGALVDVSDLEGNELVDLFASVMLGGVNHLLRRGLDQSYVPNEQEIAGVRGRVLVGATVRRFLTAHGRAYCRFDELSVDSLPNRILRSTIGRLLRAPSLDDQLRLRLSGLDKSLGGISIIPLNKQVFRTVQLHGNNGFYRFLLSVCELILEVSLVAEESGDVRFRDFFRDERQMARLFEGFVFNFYRVERPDLDVRRDRIYWAASSEEDPALTYLPTMQTDISIRGSTETLIIDTKYYSQTLQANFGSESVHSGNLFQMYAYLKNLARRGGKDATAQGMLLYPAVNKHLRLSYDIDGHRIRICTIDLGQHWLQVKRELSGLVAGITGPGGQPLGHAPTGVGPLAGATLRA